MEDYHIKQGSPAIDAGIDGGVYRDYDNEMRPFGDGFDIGADEFMLNLFLPVVMRWDNHSYGAFD